MRIKVIGSGAGILAAIGLAAAMLPLRSHLAIATAALVLVVPVVLGVALGGLSSGLISLVAGFLVYDVLFIPPYGTLTVGSPQNWVALAVYAAIMVIVSRLVASLRSAQEAARSRADSARHLLDLSELLLTEDALLKETIVGAVRDAFDIEGVSLLQSVDGHLQVTASAGTPIPAAELARLHPESNLPVPLSTGSTEGVVQTLALASSGRPVGLLALRNAPPTRAVREALPILANHLAIALERGELQARMHHAELLEEVDRLRQALVGAVSHDLRTPLATIKVASSTLLDRAGYLPAADVKELYSLIDEQTDRLARLVSNLLDMTRIQSGALEVERRPTAIGELVADALAALRSALGNRKVEVIAPPSVPKVDADPLLIVQVLANLIDNANRHAPEGSAITVEASEERLGEVVVAVVDRGAGVPAAEREAVFSSFVRFDTGGRSGLGLAIAKAFVDAHGGRIWVEEAQGGGARFAFTLAAASGEASTAPA